MSTQKRIKRLEDWLVQRPAPANLTDIGAAIAATYGVPYEPVMVTDDVLSRIERIYGDKPNEPTPEEV